MRWSWAIAAGIVLGGILWAFLVLEGASLLQTQTVQPPGLLLYSLRGRALHLFWEPSPQAEAYRIYELTETGRRILQRLPGDRTYAVLTLSPGVHVLTVKAVMGGAEDRSSARIVVEIPQEEVSSPPQILWLSVPEASPSPVPVFFLADADECSVNGQPAESPFYLSLPDGQQTVVLECRRGNQTVREERTVVVDSTPPSLLFEVENFTLRAGASDPHLQRCCLEGGLSECWEGQPREWTLDFGEYMVSLTCWDEFGNSAFEGRRVALHPDHFTCTMEVNSGRRTTRDRRISVEIDCPGVQTCSFRDAESDWEEVSPGTFTWVLPDDPGEIRLEAICGPYHLEDSVYYRPREEEEENPPRILSFSLIPEQWGAEQNYTNASRASVEYEVQGRAECRLVGPEGATPWGEVPERVDLVGIGSLSFSLQCRNDGGSDSASVSLLRDVVPPAFPKSATLVYDRDTLVWEMGAEDDLSGLWHYVVVIDSENYHEVYVTSQTKLLLKSPPKVFKAAVYPVDRAGNFGRPLLGKFEWRDDSPIPVVSASGG